MFKPSARTLRNNAWYMALLAIPFALYVFMFVVPVVQALTISFYKWDGLAPVKTYVGFDNFIRLFTARTKFAAAFKNTMIFTLFSMTVGTSLGLVIASLIHRPSRVNYVLRTVFYIPGVLSTIAVAFMWSNAIYNPAFGILNAMLDTLGLGALKHTWLGELNLIIWSVAVVQVYMDFGINIVLFIAGLQDIPKDYYEAAGIEGANAIQQFFYITIPSLRAVISLVAVLSMISAMRSFDLIYVLADTVEVMSTFLFKEMFTYGRVGSGAAAAILLLILMFAFSFVQDKLIKYQD